MKQLSAKNGPDIFKSDKKLYLARQVASQLGVSICFVLRLCKRDIIPYQRCGRTHLLNKDSIETIRKHINDTTLSNCVICGDTIKKQWPLTGSKRRVVCSSECRKEYLHDHRKKNKSTPGSKDNLQGWHLELWQKLQGHTLLNSEKWVTQGEAARYTDLSDEQINWLWHREIITSRPHPTRKWRQGQPVKQFAMSELEIVREVWQA